MQVHRPRAIPVTERISDWVVAQQARPPAPTLTWTIVFLLGAATLAFSIVLSQVFPATGAAVPPGFGSPVIAFEFARNQADLLAIFGDNSDPKQIARLIAMQSGNEQDYLFMLLYAAFLSTGCWALWRELRRPLLLLGVAMPVLAALFDAYENWLLFDIQAAFAVGDFSTGLASLAAPVWAKFLLLTATNILIGQAMSHMPSRRWQLVGVLVIVPCVATIMALIAPMAFGWTLGAAIGAGWIALLGAATIGAWRALLNKRPLVNFDPDTSTSPLRWRKAKADAVPADDDQPNTPIRPATFGRRRADGPDESPQ